MHRSNGTLCNASMYTLGEAAKATGRSKSTILRALNRGALSATKDNKGRYQIDPAELHQVFRETVHETPDRTPRNSDEITDLRTRLAVAERLAEERQQTIADLRRRLDREGEERRKLMAMLTGEDERKPPSQGFFQRKFSSR